MKKIFNIIALLLLSDMALFAQRSTEDFELIIPTQKVQHSLYNKIVFLDSRYDTTFSGIIQLGAFNKKARVIIKNHLSYQLTNVMDAFIDNTAKEGELLFQLRQFSFAEITGAMSEKGYFYLRASLYAKTGIQYQKLSAIDTVIFIKAMDVTRALLRDGSNTITGFIASQLLKTATSSNVYTLNEVIQIDSIEKMNIPLYYTSHLSEGMYTSYLSFFNQIPDKQILVEMRNDEIYSVKTLEENNKTITVKSKNIYAFVYNGKAYISTAYGFYPLRKIKDDFLFTGEAEVSANSGDVMMASVFFGVIGGLIASSNSDATFEMKIDHINGGFIRLRKIE